MRRRWLVCTAITAGLLLPAGLAVWLTTPPPQPVNRANFERIQAGMTRAEVEAILHCPPGDYGADPRIRLIIGFGDLPWGRWEVWTRACITIANLLTIRRTFPRNITFMRL
jgi:hypothetical protein